MKKAFIVGVMGGGEADPELMKTAEELGAKIAESGWVLLNGGRNAGVMAASARGANRKGGLTIGILPDQDDRYAAPDIHIPIVTGMGNARNIINVLSSNVVVALPGGPGTFSEIALALKAGKPLILMGAFFAEIRNTSFFSLYDKTGKLVFADTPEDVIQKIKALCMA